MTRISRRAENAGNKLQLVGRFSIAALAVITSAPSFAQTPIGEDAVASSTNSIGDIVVTARKREERLQDVPIAITAITSEALVRNSITSSNELQRLSPNFTIGALPNASYASQPSIRGQVQEEVLISVDPSVAVYFDGVYVARQSGGVFDTIDVARIEVVKGPQGTLFGRNTTGGAVNVFTNRPDPTGDVGGWIKAGVESFGGRRLAGVVNVPLSPDLAVRFAGQYFNSDGHIKDVVTGGRRYGHDDWQGRASVMWRPSPVLEIFGMYDRFEGRLKGGAALRLTQFQLPNLAAPGGPIGLGALEASLENRFNVAPFGGSGRVPSANLNDYVNLAADETAGGEIGFARLTNQLAVLNVTAELSDTLSAKVIYGWRRSDDSRADDLDGTPALLVNATAQFGATQHTVEAQLLGEAMEDRLKWIAGGFYFDEQGFSNSQNFFIPLVGGPNQGIFEASANNKSYAAFGQFDFEIVSDLTLTGGLRHTWDEKGVVLGNRSISFANPARPTFRVCNIPTPIDVDGPDPANAPGSTRCEGRQSKSFAYFSWLGSLNYKLSSDTLIWGKVAQASRGGGFNIRAGVSGVDAAPFDPETIREYELGLKTTFLDGKARLNVAAFLAKGKGLQRTVLLNTPAGVATVIQNAARGTFSGFEVETSWRLTPELTFDLSGGYLNAKFDQYVDGAGNDLRPTTQFRFTADWTGNIGLTYQVPVSFGKLMLNANAYHVQNYRPVAEKLASRGGREVDYTLVNARAQIDAGPVSAAVFVKNLTDETYAVADFNFIGQSLGYTGENTSIRRQWGVEVTYRF